MKLDVDIRLDQGRFHLDACFAAADGITVLFGPSGSGKSTLLSAIAGLKRCRGRITLGSRTLADCSARLHLPPHKREVGLVFQDARLFPHLTVRQNIAYARRRTSRQTVEIADAAGFFDIAPLLDRAVTHLSGGEKSRVALARALVARPEFLLLDEPFAALDGARRRAFIALLRNMHRAYQLPMLVVTHNIDDAAALATGLVALQDGAVVASGAFDAASRTAAFAALLDARDTGAPVAAATLRSSQGADTRALWLRADQVLLSSQPPRAISARNVLPGEICAIQAESADSRLVRLHTQAGEILSRVTADAVDELGLAVGRPAWALVKAHAL